MITTVLRVYIHSALSMKVFTFTKLLCFFQETTIVTADGKAATHGPGMVAEDTVSFNKRAELLSVQGFVL